MLKNSFTSRLLKKVQMQGGAPGTHPQDGCRCEAYLRVRRSAARARQRGRWAVFSSLLNRDVATFLTLQSGTSVKT